MFIRIRTSVLVCFSFNSPAVHHKFVQSLGAPRRGWQAIASVHFPNDLHNNVFNIFINVFIIDMLEQNYIEMMFT